MATRLHKLMLLVAIALLPLSMQAQGTLYSCDLEAAGTNRDSTNVVDIPPIPTDIVGPDTICPGYSAQYKATPTSSDYYIQWEWYYNDIPFSYSGDSINIQFGIKIHDIYVSQVNRRTGRQSAKVSFHVSPFRLSPFPYDTIHIRQGQRITLDRLRDQSDDDVLYEWSVTPTNSVSIQGSHQKANVELIANYTYGNTKYALLVLERHCCSFGRFDTALVVISKSPEPDNVRLSDATSDLGLSKTKVHCENKPRILNDEVYRHACEKTPFSFSAKAVGNGLTYRWEFDDGSYNYGKEIDHVFGNMDCNRRVRLIVTDIDGCSDTAWCPIVVDENPFEYYCMHQLSYAECPGNEIMLVVDGCGGYGSNNNYSWSPCDSVDGKYAFVYEEGTYHVDITSKPALCRKQLTLHVSYPSRPQASIVCDSVYRRNEKIDLIGNVGPDFLYRWDIYHSDHHETFITANVMDYMIMDTGTYKIKLTVTDTHGCASTDETSFIVYDPEVQTAEGDREYLKLIKK